jgi:hypothetical protein
VFDPVALPPKIVKLPSPAEVNECKEAVELPAAEDERARDLSDENVE